MLSAKSLINFFFANIKKTKNKNTFEVASQYFFIVVILFITFFTLNLT